jgi:hypothetical protein
MYRRGLREYVCVDVWARESDRPLAMRDGLAPESRLLRHGGKGKMVGGEEGNSGCRERILGTLKEA